MKVIYFVIDKNFFFSHRYISYLAAIKKKHEVIICCPDSKLKKKILDNINNYNKKLNFYHFKFKKKKNLKILSYLYLIFEFRKIIKKLKPDIIFSSGYPLSFLTNFFYNNKIIFINLITGLGILKSKNIVNILISFIFIRFWSLLNNSKKKILKVYQNKDDKKFFLSHGFYNKNVLIPGAGIDLSVYKNKKYPKYTNNILKAGYVGRIIQSKRVLELISAIKIINKNRKIYELHIAGNFDYGNYNPIYTEKFYEQIDNCNIFYHGFVDSKQFWKDKHLACLISEYEGLPKMLLEAAALSRPILATNTSGCKYVVKNFYNGFLIDYNNNENLIDALEEIYFKRDQLLKYGNRGRKIIKQKKLDKNSIQKKYESLFNID